MNIENVVHLKNTNIPDYTKSALRHERAIRDEIVFYAKQLPICERVMIFMRFRDGYKYSEIAAAFGVCEGTINRRLKYIAEKLCKAKKLDVLKEPTESLAVV